MWCDTNSGERTRLACWFRRPRRNDFSRTIVYSPFFHSFLKVREHEGVLASTRGRVRSPDKSSTTEVAADDLNRLV